VLRVSARRSLRNFSFLATRNPIFSRAWTIVLSINARGLFPLPIDNRDNAYALPNLATAAEKLQGFAIVLVLMNTGEKNDWRISRKINVLSVVGISSRAKKLLENVAALLKMNGLVIVSGQNIQHE